MFRKLGLIAKIKDDYCIIVTRDGTYKKVPLPEGGARLGMEISYRAFDFYPLLKPVMLAASLLILLFGFSLFRQTAPPQAVAYVSLDINPSLEISVDKNLQVINVDFFNDDGIDLVTAGEIKGKNLYAALEVLIQKAIVQKYIKPDQKNLMISTIAAGTAATTGIDPNKLQQVLENAVAAGGLSGEVKVYPVTAEVRTAAQKNGLSPGKFIIYEQAKDAGTKVTIDEVKQNSIRQLVDVYKIQLLPNHKNIIVEKDNKSGKTRVRIEESGPAAPVAVPGKADGVNDSDDDMDDRQKAADKNRAKAKEDDDYEKKRQNDSKGMKREEEKPENEDDGQETDKRREETGRPVGGIQENRSNKEKDDDKKKEQEKDQHLNKNSDRDKDKDKDKDKEQEEDKQKDEEKTSVQDDNKPPINDGRDDQKREAGTSSKEEARDTTEKSAPDKDDQHD